MLRDKSAKSSLLILQFLLKFSLTSFLMLPLIFILVFFGGNAIADTATCAELSRTESSNWYGASQSIMGTEVRVELSHKDQALACEAIAAVMQEMRRIDTLMSPSNPVSQLYKLNMEASKEPVLISEELYDLLLKAYEYSRLTDGAFDITYASVGRLYDYRHKIRPDDKARRAAIQAIDYRHVQLDPAANLVRYRMDGVYVDLGGIAKGHAVDRSIEILQQLDIKQAIVSAGGDSRIIGDRDGEPWMVGIRDPRNDAEMVAILPLLDISVSTSGDYERYFETNGIRYHHIINPANGDAARAVRSVTILAANATKTDALSTSVFVMGVEKGLRMINAMQEVDAIIIDHRGKMYTSDSLMEMTGR
ncbi:MAG: FAD:protein FMN transferase [Pseudomonadales bacterium]|nr:FAD:protein FMN transferase [Pseudomonadales bacterium]